MIYVGTSGFSYKEWKGSFYPEDLPQKEYLHYYSTQFNSTELNNTFYRMPRQEIVAKWAATVPDGFRFAVKMNQRVTHRKKLQNVGEEMTWFLTGISPMVGKLGVVLVQLPPWFKQDLPLLADFLQTHAARVPLAFEFRHDSWVDDTTIELLTEHKASWGVIEVDETPALREVTAPFTYVRLRKKDYTPEELQDWADWCRAVSGDVFVYFKHESQAPVWANRLLATVDE